MCVSACECEGVCVLDAKQMGSVSMLCAGCSRQMSSAAEDGCRPSTPFDSW